MCVGQIFKPIQSIEQEHAEGRRGILLRQILRALRPPVRRFGDLVAAAPLCALCVPKKYSRKYERCRLGSVLEMIVIARGAKRAAAIELDCFVVPQGGLLPMTKFETHPETWPRTHRQE